MGSETNNNLEQNSSKEKRSESSDKQELKRNEARNLANDVSQISSERLSSRPSIEVGKGEEDITDKNSAETRNRLWKLAEKNIDKNAKEYRDNENIAEDKATFAKAIVNGRAVISVYVKGNTSIVVQNMEMGSFDIDNNIVFAKQYEDPNLSATNRTDINEKFRSV